MLPTADVEENAVIGNTLQRHSAVDVQKSLHEGFGLTVTEAMWKARPVVASAVGGKSKRARTGFLRDPMNLQAFAETVHSVLVDPALAARIGTAARERGYGRNFSGFGTSFSMGLSLRSCWAPCEYQP